MKCEASRNERKRNETKEELEKIQERISYSIDQYEYSSKRALELLEESAATNGTHMEVIDDPSQLYELLADTKHRAQYKHKFAVFIVGYEQKCENREKLLTQVEDFFIETKASNIAKLAADEASSEEINFDDTMATISVALETTSGALAKLHKLQQDISQVFAVYAAFPNDKKGRKKLEKALLKAQEDCNSLNTTVAKVQRELDEMKEKSKKLQKQLEAKSSEVTKLRKSNDESKSLKAANDSLKQEIKEANGLLLKAREENDKLQQSQTSTVSVSVNAEYLKLKGELESQRTLNEQLSNEHQVKQDALHSEIETIKENYEAEIKEMRDKFEEQMKSLMDLDDAEFDEQSAGSKESLDITCDEQDFAIMNDQQEIVAINDLQQVINDQQDIGEVINDQQDNILISDQQNIMINQQVDEVLTETHEQSPTTTQKKTTQHEDPQDKCISKCEAERKLEEELKEVKSKSKKLATSFKAQIADQQSKHEVAIRDQDIEMQKVRSQLNTLKEERQLEKFKFDDLVAEKDKIEHELSQAISTSHEQSQIIHDLHGQLEEALQTVEDNTHPNMLSHSVQWETPIHTGTTNTPVVKSFVSTSLSSHGNTPLPSHGNTPLPSRGNTPLRSPGNTPLPSRLPSHVSLPITNCTPELGQESTLEHHSGSESAPMIVPMQEVPLEDDKSSGGKTNRSRRQSTSSQAVLTRLEETQEGEILSTSDISTVLCSADPTRRLPPAMTLNNPVVKECVKAYKSVMTFKKRIVELISNIGNPQSVAELNAIEEVADDITGMENVHSQVTLMRYNSTLVLNKIEQVLVEEMKRPTMTQLTTAVGEGNKHHVIAEDDGLTKLKVELRNAKHVLKMKSRQHHKALQDMETANESLKAEIAYLKRKAVENEREGSELIMFTRLDSDRNTESLKSALQSNKISDDVYSQTVKTMEEYTSISSGQFVNLARQYKHSVVVNRMMTDLEGISVSKKEIIKERVTQFSQTKIRQLSAELDELRVKRTHLADALTATLGEIENDTDVFLIKPIVRGSKRNWLEPSLRLPSKSTATLLRYRLSNPPSWKVRQNDVCNHTTLCPKLQQVKSTADNRSTLVGYLQSQQRRRTHVTEATSPIIVSGSEPPTRKPRLVKVEKKWNVADSVVVKPHHDVDTTALPPINIPVV